MTATEHEATDDDTMECDNCTHHRVWPWEEGYGSDGCLCDDKPRHEREHDMYCYSASWTEHGVDPADARACPWFARYEGTNSR